ncbi:MAG: hypothetical protein ACOX16_02495 [Candidatus Izemoplasmatales bacterium]|jgi:hypothetical protein
MHKLVFTAIGLFIIASLVLVLTEKDKPQTIEILALKENRSLLISDNDENVIITLFLSQKDSFFTAIDYIQSCRIEDDEEEIELEVIDIIAGNEVLYKGNTYWQYQFVLGFHEVFVRDSILEFADARCVVEYENDVELAIAIGGITLCLIDICQTVHLDFLRLFGNTEILSEGERLASITIELENRGFDTVMIKGIETYVTGMDISLDNGSIIIDGESEPITIESFRLPPGDGVLCNFKVNFVNDSLPVYRFPLFITYEYLGIEYKLIIDDFPYFRKAPFYEVDDAIVATYLYHY